MMGLQSIKYSLEDPDEQCFPSEIEGNLHRNITYEKLEQEKANREKPEAV